MGSGVVVGGTAELADAGASTRLSGPLMPQPDAVATARSAAVTTAQRAARGARRGSRNIVGDGITAPARRAAPMSADAGFLAAADATLAAIGAALDRALADSDADVDWSLVDGILEIACEGGGKVIVNRHAPNRELWVAARSGGWHFRAQDGRWRDTRGGQELGAALAHILKEQAGLETVFDLKA